LLERGWLGTYLITLYLSEVVEVDQSRTCEGSELANVRFLSELGGLPAKTQLIRENDFE
jgi:hypothetical protein